LAIISLTTFRNIARLVVAAAVGRLTQVIVIVIVGITVAAIVAI